jgi:predicted PolB exonuclease-like 3'-5' exonuclease
VSRYPLAARLADLANPANQDGAEASAFAILRSAELRQTAQGKPYWNLNLADRSASVAAKVWEDAEDAQRALAALSPGAAVKVAFRTGRYQGGLQLRVLQIRAARPDDEGFRAEQLYGEVPAWLPPLACRTLVFDIETVPDGGIRDMPPTIVKALTEFAKRKDIDETAVRGLSPFFGKIVSLAFADGERAPEDQPITALVVPRQGDDLTGLPDWAFPMQEEELLQAFWSLASLAETVVTYNGRGFDLPFLVGRSLIHDIPARVDLLSNRYALRPHLDLLEVLGQRGRGPSNLDVVCWALGIDSPKGSMDGSMVAPAYESGRIAEIAAYNREDVRATSAVYRRVRDLVLGYRTDWS